MRSVIVVAILFIFGCSKVDSTHYPNYEEKRGEAAARCAELGLLIGSPEFYSCVGTQYTRIKTEEYWD